MTLVGASFLHDNKSASAVVNPSALANKVPGVYDLHFTPALSEFSISPFFGNLEVAFHCQVAY